MKKLLQSMAVWSVVLALLGSYAVSLAGCAPTPSDPVTEVPTTTEAPLPEAEPYATINGVPVDEFVIVYAADGPDYCQTAALYIQEAIYEAAGVELAVVTDQAAPAAHEILVGETARALSATLDADTAGMEFALLADGESVAMEGDFFVIAAAAYYFVDTYIEEGFFEAVIPEEVGIHTPIVEAPKNYIFLIGDGMGEYQTKILDYVTPPAGVTTDGEDLFYGYLFPYVASSKTYSLSGITDSAAGGTALATGYKTLNGFVGKDKNLQDVQSLTELADSLGMATAVMSTEPVTGATPASFSAHAADRELTADITASQAELENTILCSVTDTYDDAQLSAAITEVLDELSLDEDGFFLMYEEAYIDKHCHSNDLTNTARAVLRFNQAIGLFMEYAFYHPATLVLITADHETGSLTPESNGMLAFHGASHSGKRVPVFAYGRGAEVFDGVIMENVRIPITLAHLWGVADFGDSAAGYTPLGN